MKISQLHKRLIGLGSAFVVVLATLLMTATAVAVPYTGENTPPLPSPAFNQYTGVPSVGNEADFLRGRESGVGDFVNDVSSACNVGQEFSLRAYVHNGASQDSNNNGTGPSVAHNTNIRVALPANNTASNFPITAFLTSSNAGSMSDSMSINCNGKVVKLNYVTGSAIQVSTLSGTKALSDSIVTTGAPIGTMTPNGDVWGCWEQRVWVYLKVKVAEVPPAPSTGECKVADLKTYDNRRVKVTVTGHTSNAEIVGYEINWGDGTAKSNKQSDEHTYATDGTFTIVTRVQVKFADGHTEWKTAEACTKKVTFNPVTPPQILTPAVTEMPKTGPGQVLGIFAATSIAGTFAYRLIWLRRFTR